MNLQRQPIPMLPLDRRTGMTEVEVGYDEQEAMAEAQRCLHCWINTIFEGSEQDGTHCVLCGGCVDVCPENCLELVPLDRIDFDPQTLDAIANNPTLTALSWKAYSRRNWAASQAPRCSRMRRDASVAAYAPCAARRTPSPWRLITWFRSNPRDSSQFKALMGPSQLLRQERSNSVRTHG